MPLPRLSDLLRTPGEPRRRFPAGRAQRGPAPPGRRPSAAAFREGEQRPCHPPASRAAGDAGPQAVPRAHSPRRTAEAPSDGAGGSQRFPPPAGRAGRGGYGAGSGAGTGRDQGRARGGITGGQRLSLAGKREPWARASCLPAEPANVRGLCPQTETKDFILQLYLNKGRESSETQSCEVFLSRGFSGGSPLLF